jgi:hypothetical protein
MKKTQKKLKKTQQFIVVKNVTLIHIIKMILTDIITPKNIYSMLRNVFQSKILKKTHMNVIVEKYTRIILVYGDTKKSVK